MQTLQTAQQAAITARMALDSVLVHSNALSWEEQTELDAALTEVSSAVERVRQVRESIATVNAA